MVNNNDAKGKFEELISPEIGEEALEIARIAREILPTKENKCACPYAARAAQVAIDLLISTISTSPQFITYRPHLDDDLAEIDHYIKETDRLCGLDGILSELSDTGDKVHTIIKRDRALYGRTVEETTEHVKKYLDNIRSKFRSKLKNCGEEKEYKPFPIILTDAQQQAFNKLGIPREWARLDPTYDIPSMVKHRDPIGKSCVLWRTAEGYTVTTGTKFYFIPLEGTAQEI